MKLKTGTIIGFAVGALVAVSAVLLLRPPTQTTYNSIRVDGNALKSLYNGNFSKMNLNFRIDPATHKFDLLPEVLNSAGAPVLPPAGLVRILATGNSIAGDRTLVGYTLEHNRIHHFVQLQTLDSIITRNPGGYFVLNAADYKIVNPSDLTHIYYQVVAYRSNGTLIDISRVNPRAVQINPCPPARQY